MRARDRGRIDIHLHKSISRIAENNDKVVLPTWGKRGRGRRKDGRKEEEEEKTPIKKNQKIKHSRR